MTSNVVPVGLLTSYVKDLLDNDALLADLWVEGEVSNLFRAQSGHTYFTLKDSEAQLKCALFRHHAGRQRWQPRAGEQIAAHGHISVYERDGAYQLYVDVVQPAGVGLLALQLEQLRQRLEAEGLFEPSRKRPIPAAPRCIGVVTSPDGAVWHDIQQVIRRRYPLTELIMAPTSVQGDQAPAGIVTALHALQAVPRVEVIIVARGGGSLEDLWAFNDERVARAVFACRLPVVSGIGHETDWTIIDDVADLRAPTPSAAAELCVPAQIELARQVVELRSQLDAAVTQALTAERWRLESTAGRIGTARSKQVDRIRVQLNALTQVLRALDPHAVLDRGYSVLRNTRTHNTISSVEDVTPGQELLAELRDGSLRVRVHSRQPSA